jgi:hypothetical protein
MNRLPTVMHRLVVAASILLLATLACSIGQRAVPEASAPSVTLTHPLPGQTAPVGEPISVDSTSIDADGVQRVELWVDDTLLRVDSNPKGSSPYIVSQSWQSDLPGTHVILVKAFDAQGVEGQSQPVVITLEAAAQTLPQFTPVAQASPIPGGEETPSTPMAPSETPTPSPLPTETPTSVVSEPTNTPGVMCTPPPCQADEVYYCPGDCPGGCGTQCATPTPTTTPPSFEPTGIDTYGVLKPVWEKPKVQDYLGYPTAEASADRRYARQYFEHGYLYWWDRPGSSDLIWAVEMPQPAAGQGFRWGGPYEDTWDGGDSFSCDAARANPNGPVRGFGKLWCDHPEIAQAIGGAREPEDGTGSSTNYGVVQFFQGGVMLYSPLDREIWVLFKEGTWQRHPVK